MPLPLEILVNAADILILTFVIYKILVFLKGNRAMQLAKGVVLLIIIYYLSGWFHLEVVHLLLSKSWSVFLLMMIIVFQPELRGLLERLGGKGASLSSPKVGHKEKLILEIVKVLSAAADSKTGVLIVVEGKTGLKNYIDTGTVIEAAVSSELLGNIFFKNAPLHDGAVILRGNRIAAAGCIIPLSDSVDLDPSYGTRHRAALGISEVSDGLSLVVSEETGLISAAMNGVFMEHLTLDEVETLLRDFYSDNRRKKKRGKRRSK